MSMEFQPIWSVPDGPTALLAQVESLKKYLRRIPQARARKAMLFALLPTIEQCWETMHVLALGDVPTYPGQAKTLIEALEVLEIMATWCNSKTGALKLVQALEAEQEVQGKGPFGVILDDNSHVAKRGAASCDVGSRRLAWAILVELCSRHPQYYPPEHLRATAWKRVDAPKPDMGAFRVQLGYLNNQLQAIRLRAKCKRNVGYRLEELPKHAAKAKRRDKRSKAHVV
jgi:hypothetical protein